MTIKTTKISSMQKCILVFTLLSGVFTAYAQNAATLPERKVIPGISTGKFTEFAPTISADGRTMIFESNRDKSWKLYSSYLDDGGKWSDPFPLSAINDKLNFLAGPSLSYDGNTLYFTGFIEEVTTSEDIFYSVRLDGKNWSEPKNIGAPINTDGYEGFPSISADGKALYFIRVNEENPFDKKSKENCFKIFVTYKKDDGTWGEPQPLPATVNSGCERDPKIMADNHTLIFSSIKPTGKGKYDLYQTRESSNGNWEEPVALDFVNGADNDQSPCISAAGDIIFFYSKEDIYSISIPQEHRQMINVTVQGIIKDGKTNNPIQAKIIVTNTTNGKTFTSGSNANDGRYSVVLGAGQQYKVKYISDEHVPETVDYDLRAQDKYIEVKNDVSLKSEYTLNVTVLDKDLNTPITAWLKASEQNGPVLINDSLRVNQYPYKLTLKAGKSIVFTAAAPACEPLTSTWKFNTDSIKSDMSYSLLLQHEKISYSTEVVNVVSHQKVKPKIYFKNENSDEVIIAEAGETVQLRKGDRYQVVTSSDKGYLFTSTSIVAEATTKNEAEGNQKKEEQKLTLEVTPIETGAQLTLDHISFSINSSDLNNSSHLALERIAELLQKNPNIHIEIAAHTDDVGDVTYNQRLSERRALSIVRHLNTKGIHIGRMNPIGHGKHKPLVPNDSDENRARNRRVELKVLRVGK
jgi:outer membrane protein OmpA-like peptidoglycan-associated protein/Tol biopolymer transport system component